MLISNLSVSIAEKPILHALNLEIASGSLEVIMGPNGSGKSTLAFALMGHPAYQITAGSITLNGRDITQSAADKRARAGLFLAFQHPYEIPGVTIINFLKEMHAARTGKAVAAKEFQELLAGYLDLLKLDPACLYRELNYGFSGGEKKKLELLQMLVLQPAVAILDEIDSGLDVDAIKSVAQALSAARAANPSLSILLITHYPRLLAYLEPDRVHIMSKGTLVQSGPAALAATIELRGYDAIL
jgi:Fe-S cluster assembly ATP-binding protein